jgi:hypothetical protein
MPSEILATIGGVKTLLDIVKYARDLRTNAPITASNTNEVVVNLWGSILYELREGCERARLFTRQAKENFLSYATFSFEICDAIFPEFCRLVPSPALLVPTAGLLAELRQIDHFQRAARPAATHQIQSADPLYSVSLGFAQAFLRRGGVETFNDILRTADAVARVVYQKAPHEKISFLLPEPIDTSVLTTEHGDADSAHAKAF